MSTREVGTKLVALCREGKFDEAIGSLYADDCVSVEPAEMPGFPREARGLDAIVTKAKWFGDNHEVHGVEVKGPWLHGDDRFAVYFKMDVTAKYNDNQRIEMEEVGVYTVKGGKVVREEFYFDTGA